MLGKKKSSLFLSIFLLHFCLVPAIVAQIQLGSKLSVEAKNQWVSPNGDFAIGFFNRLNQYGIGIRISSGLIPVEKQPVVWVAGADLRVGDRSYFELTNNGELVLFDSTRGVVVWASKTANSSVSSAFLQDNGNLNLLNKNKDVVWQSFDTPSDTLLPGQNLSANQVLRAASRNSISSFYSLRMGVSGDLELKWENDVIYWRSLQPGLRAMLASDGTLQLFDEKSSPVWSVFGDDHGELDVHFRILRLDVDGNLRLYSWAKSSTSWKSVWQAVENQCNVFATCGINGICSFNESSSPVCKCPFSLTSSPSPTCLLPYQETCKSGSSMVKLDRTILNAIYPPNETIISQVSSVQCQELCQKDHFCTAATFLNDGSAKCQIKKTRYISGQSGLSINSISFVKRCSDPIAVIPILSKSKPTIPRKDQDPNINICVSCVIGVGGGTIIVFVVIHIGLLGFWIFRKRYYFTKDACSTYKPDGPNPSGFLAFSYDEIKEITENFKHQIGKTTFKGVLSENRLVFVKDFSVINVDSRKFRCGVLKLGSVHHKNLIRFEGYCCESGYKFMVHEFVKNRSLDKCLEDPETHKRLTWRKRVDLCLAVARAISYLHIGCREFIGHGRLTCENVVLDENFEAKVNGFGLENFFGDGSNVGQRDVRDFGYIMLAVVSGDMAGHGGGDVAYEKWVGGDVAEIVDTRLEGGVDTDELERVLRIIFWCFQSDERMRPSMAEVVNVLEGAMAVDPPPPPLGSRKKSPEEGGGSGSESDL